MEDSEGPFDTVSLNEETVQEQRIASMGQFVDANEINRLTHLEHELRLAFDAADRMIARREESSPSELSMTTQLEVLSAENAKLIVEKTGLEIMLKQSLKQIESLTKHHADIESVGGGLFAGMFPNVIKKRSPVISMPGYSPSANNQNPDVLGNDPHPPHPRNTPQSILCREDVSVDTPFPTKEDSIVNDCSTEIVKEVDLENINDTNYDQVSAAEGAADFETNWSSEWVDSNSECGDKSFVHEVIESSVEQIEQVGDGDGVIGVSEHEKSDVKVIDCVGQPDPDGEDEMPKIRKSSSKSKDGKRRVNRL